MKMKGFSVLFKDYFKGNFISTEKFRGCINSVQFEAGITRTIFHWIGCPFFVDFEIYFLGPADNIYPFHEKLDDVTEKKYQNCVLYRNCGILRDTCK